MKKDLITIKKYSNRRLYDTQNRKYITLNTVAQMIREGKEIRVIDAKTNEDLTRTVMLQIICENKPHQEALPISFLRQIIQASSQTVRSSIREFLNNAASIQKELHNQVSEIQHQFLNLQQQITSSIKQHSPDLINTLSSLISPLVSLVSPSKESNEISLHTELSDMNNSSFDGGDTKSKPNIEGNNPEPPSELGALKSELNRLKSQIELLQKKLDSIDRDK